MFIIPCIVTTLGISKSAEAEHIAYLNCYLLIGNWCQSYHFLWVNCLIKSGRECSCFTLSIHLALMRIFSMLTFKFITMEGFMRLAKNASISSASSLLLTYHIMNEFKEWEVSILKIYWYCHLSLHWNWHHLLILIFTVVTYVAPVYICVWHRHMWLHLIISFSQIITNVNVSMSTSCPVFACVSVHHRFSHSVYLNMWLIH